MEHNAHAEELLSDLRSKIKTDQLPGPLQYLPNIANLAQDIDGLAHKIRGVPSALLRHAAIVVRGLAVISPCRFALLPSAFLRIHDSCPSRHGTAFPLRASTGRARTFHKVGIRIMSFAGGRYCLRSLSSAPGLFCEGLFICTSSCENSGFRVHSI